MHDSLEWVCYNIIKSNVQQAMTAFAHALHDSRYTAAFAEHVSNMDNLSLTDPISNTTIQYVSAIMPEKEIPQLVKRIPC